MERRPHPLPALLLLAGFALLVAPALLTAPGGRAQAVDERIFHLEVVRTFAASTTSCTKRVAVKLTFVSVVNIAYMTKSAAASSPAPSARARVPYCATPLSTWTSRSWRSAVVSSLPQVPWPT